MSTPTTQQAYDWIRTLPPSILEFDEIPLIGHAVAFPWQKAVDTITRRFELDKLSLVPGHWEWRSKDELFTGLSGEPHLIPIGLTGYEGRALFAIDKRDIEVLASSLLLHKVEEPDFIDPSYLEAFFKFIALEACDVFSEIEWEKGLQCHLLKDEPVADEPHLTMELAIELSTRTLHSRIILDNTLRKEWQSKHILPFEVATNPALAKKMNLPVSIQAGHFSMKLDEWNHVQPGDFILVDKLDLNENLQSGSLLLMVHHLPYFKAHLDNGAIILQEQPSHDEVTATMAKFTDDDDDSDFDFDDSTTDESITDDSEIEHIVPKKPAAPPLPPKAAPTASPATPAANAAAPAAKANVAATGQKTEVTKKAHEKTHSAKDIPLQIAVEIGRFNMTIEKVMEMQPGNMLSLNVHPEDGVDLVVNGRRIGKGELIRLGETLGVRITEI